MDSSWPKCVSIVINRDSYLVAPRPNHATPIQIRIVLVPGTEHAENDGPPIWPTASPIPKGTKIGFARVIPLENRNRLGRF